MTHIKGYNAVRAVSIFFVILTHLGVDDLLKMNLGINRPLVLITGQTGVTIFFSLSGFLITYILLTEKTSTGTIQLKRFYLKRLLRLSPPLLIFFTIVAILMINHTIYPTLQGFLFSAGYLYNFVPSKYYTTELSHTWSLAIEEQFYLFWPIILIYTTTFKKLLSVVLVVVVLCITSHFMWDTVVVEENGRKVLLNSLYHTSRWFMPAVAPIMVGCGAAIVTFFYRKQICYLFCNSYLALAVSAILYCLPVFISKFYLPIYSSLIALASSVFLMWIFANQQSLLVSLLEWKPISYLGKISYGLYVYQGLFLTNGPGSELLFQQYPLNLILTIFLSIVSYEMIEKRVLAKKNHINDRFNRTYSKS